MEGTFFFLIITNKIDNTIRFQQALIATTVIRQMQRMALSSGSSGGRSPVPERSMSAGDGNVNGADDK